MTIDLATRQDYSVVTIGHRELVKRDGSPPVDHVIIDCARHWSPTMLGKLTKRKIDVDALEAELAELANHYRCSVGADSWGFDFVQSRFQKRGITVEQMPMHTAAQAKRAGMMLAYFTQGRISLPDGNPELLRQLKGLRVMRTPGGGVRYAAPTRKGSHDDYAKCVMLLVERVQMLQPTGGTIGSQWGADGKRRWFTIDQQGNREPCLPPMGSNDWLDLAYRCERDGTHIPELDVWLAEPGNQDALSRHVESSTAVSRLASTIRNR